MYFVIYFFIDFESFQKFNFFQFQNIFLDLYILYAQTMFIYGGNKKIQIIEIEEEPDAVKEDEPE